MLRVENVRRSWGDFRLKDISLEVKRGEYFVLLGPCGAGKTQLLNLIAGIYLPDSGKVFIDEKNATNLSPSKRDVGYLFQKNLIFPHLTVKQNIYYGLKYHKPDNDYIKFVFELLDIESILDRRDSFNLSGGEVQKVCLGRTLAIKPKLLLLDEPLHSLDPLSQQNILKVLNSLNKDLGLTIIHVTHHFGEVDLIAKSVAILIEGEIVEQGDFKEVLNDSQNFKIRKYLGNII